MLPSGSPTLIGVSTASMTWMTPFEASISVSMTIDSFRYSESPRTVIASFASLAISCVLPASDKAVSEPTTLSLMT